VIRLLRDLPENDQRLVLAMFRPEEALAVDASDLWPTLVMAIKVDALFGGESDDLPGAMRDALVDVAVRRLQVIRSADNMTDIEIAMALTTFLLRVPAAVEADENLREKMEVFFRTRDRRLLDSTIADTAAMDAEYKSARERVLGPRDGVLRGGLSDLPSDLEGVDAEGNVPQRVRLLQRTAATGVGAGTLRAFAPAPVALLAGALFMAGLGATRGGGVVGPVTSEADKARSARARKSKFVQNVVKLSVFAIASIGDSHRARVVVLRYLRELGFEFEEIPDGPIKVPAGSATVEITLTGREVEANAGRCLVLLESRLLELKNVTATEDVLVELARRNHKLPLGRLSWNAKAAAVDVSYQLLGDTLDIDELGFALARISEIADQHDDELRELFGIAVEDNQQGGK
jgi:hypothetical protein